MEWLEKILKDVENKDELIKSVKKGIGENFVSKEDFNTKNETVKTLQSQIKERDKQLETLKSSTADVEGLKNQIEQLQKDNTEANEKYQAELKEMKVSNAIKLAIAGKVHDEDLVTGLVNKENLILNEEGKVIGLDDQITKLQESKSFLFKASEEPPEEPNPQSGFKFGTGGQKNNSSDDAIRQAFGLTTGKGDN